MRSRSASPLSPLLTMMNLRGVRESGTLFAIPTYGFLVSVLLLVAGPSGSLGRAPVAESAGFGLPPEHQPALALVILVLRAFASGCTALTGVEAVSNGVPTFRAPKAAMRRQRCWSWLHCPS